VIARATGFPLLKHVGALDGWIILRVEELEEEKNGRGWRGYSWTLYGYFSLPMKMRCSSVCGNPS